MKLVEEAKALFGDEPRPEHFTDFEHCSECADHDETLRAADPDSLTLEQVSPAWDPFCFVSPEGFRYYFPALVRLAVEGGGDRYFVDQFLFHLEMDGPGNERLLAFSAPQREFVVRVLIVLLEEKADEIDACGDTDRLFRTLAVWSGTPAG